MGGKSILCNTFTRASSINDFSLNQGLECVILKGHQKIENKIPGGISRFALGFCKNKKKRAETLYQSFSPFMVDLRRFELPTPTMRMWCAPSCATSPCLQILPYYSAFCFQSQAKASAVFSLFSATGMFLPCLYPMVHYAVPPEASVLRRILTRFPCGIIIKIVIDCAQ